MSKQSRGKKRGGAAMPEDTSPTESAMLELDSPKNAGGDNPDKQGGALVLLAKAMVVEKKLIQLESQLRSQLREEHLPNW